MSYTIYETEALVLSLDHSRERGITASLLTRELGYIRAYAEGIRTSKSKMRANLTRYGITSVSLVRGRVGWRLVGAKSVRSFNTLFDSTSRAKLAVRMLHLYGRLVPDEAPGYGKLYDDIVGGLDLLSSAEVDERGLETLVVVRVLSHLGYLPQDEYLDHLLCADCSFKDLIPEAVNVRPRAIPVINQVLAESHL